MLDNQSLSQLSELKQQFIDDKVFVEGTIKTTPGRFGFVVTDEQREIYLPPAEMERVLPGDRVRVQVFEQKNQKTHGKIEALLESTLKHVSGQYSIRGKGHFLVPDINNCHQLLFVPPNARKQAADGDWVHAKISRHPFKGKPQAKILQVAGGLDKPGLESDYVIGKYQLQRDISVELNTGPAHPPAQDCSDLPLLSIDADSTRDIDDALYAQAHENGWTLSVAIADPLSFVDQSGPLLALAEQRASTLYLPAGVLPMLPEQLTYSLSALTADQRRPAVLCQIEVANDGTIQSYQIERAWVKNHHAISYETADELLSGEQSDADDSLRNNLNALAAVAEALYQQRRQQHLVLAEQQEYVWQYDQQQKLSAIIRRDRPASYRLVENCMIAANRCAADFLGDEGIFVQHDGFRSERQADVCKLGEEQLQQSPQAIDSLSGYIELMRTVEQRETELPLQAILSRLLSRSQLSTSPKPHFGMGLPRYTTFTSPLRRYPDLLVHALLYQRQGLMPTSLPAPELLQQVQQQLLKNRQIQKEAEQWLACQYLAKLQGECKRGHIVQINSRGFTVQLDDCGLTGTVANRDQQEKFSFDPMRMRLKSANHSYQLQQALDVIIEKVDLTTRTVRLKPA